MAALLERDALAPLRAGGGERRARAELRRQIGRLEHELAGLFAEAFPRVEVDTAVPAPVAGPRIADLGELERVRDALSTKIAEAHRTLARRAEMEADAREALERMLADPAAHKWERISRDDLGVTGCGHWHSRPRLGPIGMLMGWWRVKISSGCPLPGRLAAVERNA